MKSIFVLLLALLVSTVSTIPAWGRKKHDSDEGHQTPLIEQEDKSKQLFYQTYGFAPTINGPVCAKWQTTYLTPALHGTHTQVHHSWYSANFCEDGTFNGRKGKSCFLVSPDVLFELGYKAVAGHFTRCIRYDGPTSQTDG